MKNQLKRQIIIVVLIIRFLDANGFRNCLRKLFDESTTGTKFQDEKEGGIEQKVIGK